MRTEPCDDEIESLPLPKSWAKAVHHAVLNVVGLVRVAMLAGREFLIQNGDVLEAHVHRLETELALLRTACDAGLEQRRDGASLFCLGCYDSILDSACRR